MFYVLQTFAPLQSAASASATTTAASTILDAADSEFLSARMITTERYYLPSFLPTASAAVTTTATSTITGAAEPETKSD